MSPEDVLAAFGELVPAEAVMKLEPRWTSASSLARASKAGRGPGGRHVFGTRSAYEKTAVLEWLGERDARAERILEAQRARAANARAARATRRAEGRSR